MDKSLHLFSTIICTMLALLLPLKAGAIVVGGDVNGDGEVSIADVNAVIDIILSGSGNSDGDVNYDGEVGIADVNTLIDIILGGTAPTPPEVRTFTVNGVTFTMVTVEGGTFTMGGSDEDPNVTAPEKPAHQVTLTEDYLIGQTEVTQALWMAVMGDNPSHFYGDLLRPVEMVSWNKCHIFINKLNELTGETFRMPTEAEWEFAARGGNKSCGYRFSGGNIIDEIAWYAGNSESTTHPVGLKSPNELGLYDMTGNVWEWCEDWADSYSGEAQVNPTGPSSGSYRVARGAGWAKQEKDCRITVRTGGIPTAPSTSIGMRLAM